MGNVIVQLLRTAHVTKALDDGIVEFLRRICHDQYPFSLAVPHRPNQDCCASSVVQDVKIN